MAHHQSADEIDNVLARPIGRQIASLHVYGINSLKSVAPPLEYLNGLFIEDASVVGRLVTILTSKLVVTIDLQRTGRLSWLDNAAPYARGDGAMPTVRLLLSEGSGIDFAEPSKTKRITVSLSDPGKVV